MSLPFHFFALPAEVRMLIYHEYFALPDGYALSPNLRQLTTSAGEPIALHLMYTCKLVARETRGLPLILNTINFSTIHSDYLNLAAKLLFQFWEGTTQLFEWHLGRLAELINQDVYNQVVDKFPLLSQRLEYLQALNPKNNPHDLPWYNPTSSRMKRHAFDPRAIAYTLHVIISLHDSRAIDQIEPEIITDEEIAYRLPCASLAEMVRLRLELQNWSIPTQKQVNDMFKVYPIQSAIEKDDYRKRRFSATAAAIFFLDSITPETRYYLRQLRINEDGVSTQFPEGHAKGLIPFCIENPHLRIERRVDMWRAIFPKPLVKSWSTKRLSERGTNNLSYDLARWFTGALSLTSQGMPPDSLITLFDGSLAPELCSQMFQHSVRRDVAFIYAVKVLFPDEFDPDASMDDVASKVSSFFLDRFHHLELGLEYLTNGSKTFQCNFDPGHPCDPNTISLKTPRPTFMDWNCNDWILRPHTPYGRFSQWPDILRYHYFKNDELDRSIRSALENGFPGQVEG